MSLKKPCKECDERHLACHSHCEKYKEFKRRWNEMKQRQLFECGNTSFVTAKKSNKRDSLWATHRYW